MALQQTYHIRRQMPQCDTSSNRSYTYGEYQQLPMLLVEYLYIRDDDEVCCVGRPNVFSETHAKLSVSQQGFITCLHQENTRTKSRADFGVLVLALRRAVRWKHNSASIDQQLS